MKKLLTLFLVLCIAGMVNASVIQLRVDSDSGDGEGNNTQVSASSATITVISDDALPYSWFLAIATAEDHAGSFGDITILSNAGASASIDDWGSDDDYTQLVEIKALAYPPAVITAGDHFYTTLTRTGAAVRIDLMDDGWNVMDSVTLIPEPMTILLLGIGGLFLRRRK